MDLTPQLNANINDHSHVDDSIKQEGLTINASGNATINSNSGNGRASKVGMSDLFKVLGVSIVCDIALGVLLYIGHADMMKKLDSFGMDAQRIDKQHRELVESSEKTHDEMMDKARQGNVWIIRYDIMRTIDLYEVRKSITSKEYTRLKDEFNYYRSIGGNHDVQERFDQFTAKLLSGEVKVTNANLPPTS